MPHIEPYTYKPEELWADFQPIADGAVRLLSRYDKDDVAWELLSMAMYIIADDPNLPPSPEGARWLTEKTGLVPRSSKAVLCPRHCSARCGTEN
jgi:hypothetical protein